MKESVKNTLSDITRFAVGIALAYGLVKVAQLEQAFPLIVYTTAVTYGAGLLAGHAKTKVWNFKDGLLWGGLGLAASILFSAFGV